MARVELHIDTLDVGAAEIARCAQLIEPDEQARAARFRFDRDRRRFIVRRARLREILGARLGEDPRGLRFVSGPFGKPALAGGPHFSLSHSRESMMLGIAGVEVGCDLEWIDPAMDWQPVARSLFGAGECQALETAGRRGFFHCWARKEAFVKAIGRGLSYPLHAFDVSVEAEANLLRGGDGWAIVAASPDLGHAGAVVARDDGTLLEIVWAAPATGHARAA